MNSLGKLQNTHARQPLSLHGIIGLYIYLKCLETTKNVLQGLIHHILSAIDYYENAIHWSLLSVQSTLKSCSNYTIKNVQRQMLSSVVTSVMRGKFPGEFAPHFVKYMQVCRRLLHYSLVHIYPRHRSLKMPLNVCQQV